MRTGVVNCNYSDKKLDNRLSLLTIPEAAWLRPARQPRTGSPKSQFNSLSQKSLTSETARHTIFSTEVICFVFCLISKASD